MCTSMMCVDLGYCLIGIIPCDIDNNWNMCHLYESNDATSLSMHVIMCAQGMLGELTKLYLLQLLTSHGIDIFQSHARHFLIDM